MTLGYTVYRMFTLIYIYKLPFFHNIICVSRPLSTMNSKVFFFSFFVCDIRWLKRFSRLLRFWNCSRDSDDCVIVAKTISHHLVELYGYSVKRITIITVMLVEESVPLSRSVFKENEFAAKSMMDRRLPRGESWKTDHISCIILIN